MTGSVVASILATIFLSVSGSRLNSASGGPRPRVQPSSKLVNYLNIHPLIVKLENISTSEPSPQPSSKLVKTSNIHPLVEGEKISTSEPSPHLISHAPKWVSIYNKDRYQVTRFFACPGNNLKILDLNQASCIRQCDNYSRCKAAVSLNNSKCFLKHTLEHCIMRIQEPTQMAIKVREKHEEFLSEEDLFSSWQKHLVHYTLGLHKARREHEEGAVKTIYGFAVLLNVDCPGSSEKKKSRRSFLDCVKECDGMLSCKASTWWNNNCYLREDLEWCTPVHYKDSVAAMALKPGVSFHK